jgi:thymidylate kinase
MRMPQPLVIAIEGPSDSGKSTLARRLHAHFVPLGCSLMPCYVEFAGGDDCVPLGRAESPAQQLASLRTYLELDRRRAGTARACEPATLLLLDRSPHTLLAHVLGEEATGGPPGFVACRELVRASDGLLWPDVVFYLDLDDARRAVRMDPAERTAWWTSAAFNRGFARYFLDDVGGLGPQKLELVDANPSADELFADVRARIDARLAQARNAA